MSIIAIKKDETGTITNYKISDGSVIDPEQAVGMVESGYLTGYNIATAKDGKKSIRSNPDGDKENNLANLPTF